MSPRTGHSRRRFVASLVGSVPFAFAAHAAAVARAPIHSFHHENVLGTSFELQVRCADPARARAAEAAVLAEIDRLARILSAFSPDSEFSRWQRTYGTPVPVGPELFEVLSLAEAWRASTGGAFEPAVESLTQAWRRAAATGKEPGEAELATLARDIAGPAWRLDHTRRTAERLNSVPLSLNALAKGWIVDQATTLASALQGVEGVLLNLGGDLRTRGDLSTDVAIADARRDAENDHPVATICVRNAAVATSGDYRRGFDVAGRHHSHVLDPRTGRPVLHAPAVTVLAPDTATADALATAFSVMDPDEAVRLADRTPGVACLLQLADGRSLPSRDWPAEVRFAQASAPKPHAAGNADALELAIAFELNRPEGGRYARPYVAIWIEDTDNFPVRTVLLWVLQSQKGQRWIPDLRRWHRGDQTRRLADDRDLVATISSATRNPGKYSAVWDGKDDAGVPVKPGKYTVYIEAVREHGTYQLQKHEFEVGGKPFTVALQGNEEIKATTLEYRRRTAGK